MTEPAAPPTPAETYRAAFARGAASDATSKAARAYATALDNRKFEIELYWKRATYFWVFNGAALAAYLSALTGKDVVNRAEALLLSSCIGLVFATAWYFVNRASKLWQSNWEFHVDLLEDSEAGPLYKTVLQADTRFLNLGGAYPFSVSKINQWLSLFVLAVFALLVVHTLVQYYTFDRPWQLFPTACLAITAAALFVLGVQGRIAGPRAQVTAKVRTTALVAHGVDD